MTVCRARSILEAAVGRRLTPATTVAGPTSSAGTTVHSTRNRRPSSVIHQSCPSRRTWSRPVARRSSTGSSVKSDISSWITGSGRGRSTASPWNSEPGIQEAATSARAGAVASTACRSCGRSRTSSTAASRRPAAARRRSTYRSSAVRPAWAAASRRAAAGSAAAARRVDAAAIWWARARPTDRRSACSDTVTATVPASASTSVRASIRCGTGTAPARAVRTSD